MSTGGRISNTTVNAATVSYASESGLGSSVLTHASTAQLSLAELRQAKRSLLLMVANGTHTLQLCAADTAASAKSLAAALGLANQGESCFLRFAPSANPTGAMSMTNGGATAVWVQLRLKGGSAAATQVVVNSSAAAGAPPAAEALVLATLTSATAGSEVMTFDIIHQVSFNV